MDLMEKYEEYLQAKLMEEKTNDQCHQTANIKSVGIVGGGISGLYAALLLQRYVPEAKVTIFEANRRVGGRISTFKFSEEPYQYCETGAMRIPCLSCQTPVFNLIDYLNKTEPENPLKLIDFLYSCPAGNRIFVNNTKMKDGRVMNVDYASTHCSELGFSSLAGIGDDDRADKIIVQALEPVLTQLRTNFCAAIAKYEGMSLHQFLTTEAKWTQEKINYYEVMCWMTNFSHSGLIEILFNFMIRFNEKSSWKTIDGGMTALPELCAKVVRRQGGKLLLQSKVESIAYKNDGEVLLGYRNSLDTTSKLFYGSFSAVIMAVPTSCIRVMEERPLWPDNMEYALRSLRHSPIIRIILRFNSRFWERSDLQHGPSLGGMSITDLPSRWIIYPSYSIGDKGKGVLMAYIHTDDTMHWLHLTKAEKIKLFLRDLQKVYPEVDIPKEYAGGTDSNVSSFLDQAHIFDWTTQWSMGSACGYFPGQFNYMYPILAQNRGNIYFCGDHLSTNPVFISGALSSTKHAIQQLIKRQVDKNLLVEYM